MSREHFGEAQQDEPQRENRPGGIYEEIRFGVWMCDPDGGLRYASDSFLDLLGMSMEEASGSGWAERIASDDRGSFKRWQECVEQEHDWDDEHRIRDQQGRVRTLLARGHAVRDDAGKLERWIGIHLDITDRKQAEEWVKDARNFAEAITETIPVPLIVLDNEHRVVTANPAFYHQFESEREDTEGSPLHELGNGQWDIPALHNLLEEVLKEDDSFDEYEVEHDFPDIGRKVMLISGRRIEQQVNHTEMTLLAIQDVTEARQKEDRLRIVRETQAIQNERERLAHRLHDHMQQLIHAAGLHVALVQADEPNEETQAKLKKLEGILQEAGHAARDLAVELTPPVLLESGLIEALKWLADWVQDKYQLQLHLEVDQGVRLEDQSICLLLFETVRELLLNVVKHGDVRSATVQAVRKGEDWLQLVVRDEGGGFPPRAACGEGWPGHRLRSSPYSEENRVRGRVRRNPERRGAGHHRGAPGATTPGVTAREGNAF